MTNKQVFLTSNINGQVVIDVPDLHLKRLWEKKGAKKPIEFDILQQAIYDPSVEYLLKEGILFIDDMDVKIELGLEDESVKDGGAPNIVILNDNDMKRYLSVMPLFEFKEKIKGLGKEQIQNLIDYAIDNEIIDMEKCEILKQYNGIDIINTIKLKRENKGEL